MRFDTFSVNTGDMATNMIFEKNLSIPGKIFIAEGFARWYPITNGYIQQMVYSLGEAAEGAGIVFTIKKNGNEVQSFTIQPDLQTDISPITNIPFVKGDYFTVDIAQVGSSVSGTDVTITFLHRRL